MDIAKDAGAEIHFMHVVNAPVDWVNLPKAREKDYPETVHAIGRAKAQLNELEKKAQHLGLRTKQFMLFNETRDEILSHLKHLEHDFIVMGSHGSKGVREMFMGTNAQRVVRHAPVPVLVVKNKPDRPTVKTIVFASDFAPEADAVFAKVTDFARVTGAETHLLYVNVPAYFQETTESRGHMDAFRKRNPGAPASFPVWNAINEERGILQFAKEVDADVIALATHGKLGIAHKLPASITEGLVNHSSRPVLSIRIDAL